MRDPRAKLARAAARGAAMMALTVFALAACTSKTDSRAAADSALARDLALASSQTAQPTFQDTAIAPATAPAQQAKEQPPTPVRARATPKPKPQPPKQVVETPSPRPVSNPATSAPAPTPAPVAAPLLATIGSGTGVALTAGSKVCTGINLPGDKLVATVNEAVTGSNGAVIPAGSSVVLEIASVTAGENGQPAQMTFRVRSVVVNDKTYTVAANVTPLAPLEKSKVAGDPNAEKKKVIGGAIAGALIGQMIGHNAKGTIIGAAAGAATGAAVSRSSEKWEGCLPAGAPMRLTLSSALILS